MNYDITQQSIDETTFLYGEARCAHADIGDTLARLLPAAYAFAAKEGIAMLGPPMTLYTAWGPGMTTIWGGVPVATGAKAGDDLAVIVLPASQAVTTIHTGPYDSLRDGHAALEQYMNASGLQSVGAIREIYLTDPADVPNPEEWKTQLVWPIK